MKKALLVVLALLLAIPAVSFAGSATSRWDLTIGGNVKFDMGWSDQSAGNSGSDMWVGGIPERDSDSGNRQVYEKYGTQLWGAGETALNFFVKGPDTWGAKSHAFIAGDFTGFWGGATNPIGTNGPPANAYNTFNLLIAEVGFDWANTSLAFGVSGAFFGSIPTLSNSVGWNVMNFGNKGAAPVVPQVTVTQRFGKNWTAGIGMLATYNTINQLQSALSYNATNVNNSNSNMFRNPLPAFEGKIAYSSDACGKVGPWQLLFQMDGFWGQLRQIYGTDNSKKDIDEWYLDFKFLIPIIPEKNGNKTNALYADATFFATQGGGAAGNWYANAGSPFLTYPYERAVEGDFHANLLQGVYTHAQYYFTDSVSFNGYWVWSQVKASQTLRLYNPSGVVKASQYIANLQYDVNPAVRFTLEYERTVATFAAALEGYKNSGTNNAYRLAAYYFF